MDKKGRDLGLVGLTRMTDIRILKKFINMRDWGRVYCAGNPTGTKPCPGWFSHSTHMLAFLVETESCVDDYAVLQHHSHERAGSHNWHTQNFEEGRGVVPKNDTALFELGNNCKPSPVCVVSIEQCGSETLYIEWSSSCLFVPFPLSGRGG